MFSDPATATSRSTEAAGRSSFVRASAVPTGGGYKSSDLNLESDLATDAFLDTRVHGLGLSFEHVPHEAGPSSTSQTLGDVLAIQEAQDLQPQQAGMAPSSQACSSCRGLHSHGDTSYKHTAPSGALMDAGLMIDFGQQNLPDYATKRGLNEQAMLAPSRTHAPTLIYEPDTMEVDGLAVSMPRSSAIAYAQGPTEYEQGSHTNSDLAQWFSGLGYTMHQGDAPQRTTSSWSATSRGSSEAARGTQPLRSLQLVSKYFDSSRSAVRRRSAGEMHGLDINDLFSTPNPDLYTQVSIPQENTLHGLNFNTNHENPRGLRQLRLSTQQNVGHRVPRINATPELGSNGLEFNHTPRAETPTASLPTLDDSLSTVSSHATNRSSTRRCKPFSALHPPAERLRASEDAKRLFWYGFLGMPWLWLLGGWGVDNHGTLLAPWSVPSFAAYRMGLHPFGPPFALSARAQKQLTYRMDVPDPIIGDAAVFGSAHRGIRFLQQNNPKGSSLKALQQWKHIEPFVLYNRLAATLSALAIAACWATGVWAIVSHF